MKYLGLFSKVRTFVMAFPDHLVIGFVKCCSIGCAHFNYLITMNVSVMSYSCIKTWIFDVFSRMCLFTVQLIVNSIDFYL